MGFINNRTKSYKPPQNLVAWNNHFTFLMDSESGIQWGHSEDGLSLICFLRPHVERLKDGVDMVTMGSYHLGVISLTSLTLAVNKNTCMCPLYMAWASLQHGGWGPRANIAFIILFWLWSSSQRPDSRRRDIGPTSWIQECQKILDRSFKPATENIEHRLKKP